MTKITHENLISVLQYDSDTGEFRWRESGAGRKIHQPAGSILPSGYINIWIRQKQYLAHRLAWFYVHGEWPTAQIDHRNLIRNDNRISNLRLATNGQNGANRRANSASGLKGAHKGPKGFYTARITKNGITHYLGCFRDPKDAHAAYCFAAKDSEFHRTK